MVTPLTPFYITSYNKGLVTNKKPFLIANQAWQTLENAVCWRDRELRRYAPEFLGRLQRNFTNENFFLSASPWNFNLLVVVGYVSTANNANPGKITTKYPHNLSNGDKVIITGIVGATGYNNTTFTITKVDDYNFTVGVDAGAFGAYVSGGFWISNRSLTATEPQAQLVPGAFSITFGGVTITDSGNGLLTSTTPGNTGTINYATGAISITTTVAALTASVITFSYYPTLPVMGIWQRDRAAQNDEQTIWFDERYAYIFNAGQFQEYLPGFAWNGNNSDFFWAFNYQGATSANRLFFVTNFRNTTDNPMSYSDNVNWTPFAPLATAAITIFSSKLIIAYYNRLLLLNTWEGATGGGAASATNYFNRCRFSQLGDPTDQTLGWRTDIFGRGGFLDAPTNESIISAKFVKNTLIVQFEETTWQLRYVGEYGFPFVWERISADFGCESTFSGVIFDNHMLSVGDTAITASNAIGVDRIDLDIPDTVFTFKNANDGVERIWGIRDYRDEFVFWNYPDCNTEAFPGVALTYPNKVLVYNYRNGTYAIFRDNVTAFGVHQRDDSVTWDSTTVTWDDEAITWDSPPNQSLFPSICCGNQQGFVSYYNATTELNNQATLTVEAINITVSPVVITSVDHNLQEGEIIYLKGLMFFSAGGMPIDVGIADGLYKVLLTSKDAFQLYRYDFTSKTYGPVSASPTTATYVGGGTIALIPKLNLLSKDINLFQDKGFQTKVSYIDFLMQTTTSASMTVNIYLNTAYPTVRGNMLVGNKTLKIVNTRPFYTEASNYDWYRFFATFYGQFFTINLTYDDDLMNTEATHEQDWVLLGIRAFCKPAGRNTF